jgi:hypothetical protein
LIYLSVITSILTSPFNLVVEFLNSEILLAPTPESYREMAKEEHTVNGRLGVSPEQDSKLESKSQFAWLSSVHSPLSFKEKVEEEDSSKTHFGASAPELEAECKSDCLSSICNFMSQPRILLPVMRDSRIHASFASQDVTRHYASLMVEGQEPAPKEDLETRFGRLRSEIKSQRGMLTRSPEDPCAPENPNLAAFDQDWK